MIVIPAIDIKGGRCVRLRQGKMEDETVFSDVPEEMAKKWHAMGAERLHLVDLDAAVEGRPVNTEVIGRIIEAVPVPIELGGGIRDMRTLEAYLSLGLDYVILGTAAHKEPDFVKSACSIHPGRIILGIDARNGRVAIEGWTRTLDLSPMELAAYFLEDRPAAIIYTDIQRDGMRTGPNAEATRDVARSVEIPVIASGGISGAEDVRTILALAEDGVMGMITGRALYDGSLDLVEALEICRKGQ